MKKILMISAAAVVLASCAKNEVLDNEIPKADDGKIKFSSIQNLGTKAATGHPMETTDDLRALGNFYVKGFGTAAPILGDQYMDATVKYNGATWEYANEPYWPQQALNFMAYAPIDENDESKKIFTVQNTDAKYLPEINKDGVKADGFTVGENGKQIDFVVAKELGKTKENRTMLRFKHALTQINFKAMVVDKNADGTAVPVNDILQVVIDEVSINNINKQGDYSWSVATGGNTMKQNVWGNGTTAVSRTNYSADPKDKGFNVNDKGGIGSVGSVANAVRIQKDAADNNSLLMIPQNFPAWDPQQSIAVNNGLATPGAYVKLMTKIWVVRNGKDVVLHGTHNGTGDKGDKDSYSAAAIYIPVSSLGDVTNDVTNAPLGQWVPGRKINYIITFGDRTSGSGGGGWTDGEGGSEDPKPVLVPIRFTATLENWVEQDVPLLTADVKGSTADPLSTSFIKGYSDQILKDIVGAQYPKTFKAKVNVESKNTAALTADVNVSVADYLSATNRQWFRPGSTITWSAETVNWGTPTAFGLANTDFTASSGWSIAVNNNPTAPATAKTVTLTKLAESSITWTSLFEHVDQFTMAIQKNIEGLSDNTPCIYTVNVPNKNYSDKTPSEKLVLTKDVEFTAGYLSTALVNTKAKSNSTVTFNFSNIDFNGKKIFMEIPNGWNATSGTISADGYFVSITSTTDSYGTIVFTKK